MKQSYILVVLFVLLSFFTLSAKPTDKFLDPPTVTANTSSLCGGGQVTLTATGTGTIAWFTNPDGTGTPLATGNNYSPTLSSTTIYYAIATDTDGTTAVSLPKTITVNTVPVAAFTVPGGTNCANQAITFTNQSTGSNLVYSWNFGNIDSGSNNTSDDTNPSHTFIATPGNSTQTFTITLTVTNSVTGCSDSVTHTATVKQIPDASFDTSNNNGSFYDSIQGLFLNCDATISSPNFTLDLYNGSSTTSSNSSYSISWGDSSPVETLSNFNEITHDYTTLGYFNIILSVTNNSTGCTTSKLYRFFNGNSPAGNLDLLGNADDCAPYSYTWPVQNTQNNPPGTTYSFSVNDGSPAQTWTQETLPTSITHNFTQSSCGLPNNKFTVTFQITNPCATNAPTTQVQVSQKPIASFTINQQACTNNTVTLTNTSVGNYFSGQNCLTNFNRTWTISPSTGWTIVSGQLTNSNNLQIQFTTSGVYSISLNIHRPNSQNNDCTDNTHTETICVDSPLQTPTFTLSNIQGCSPVNVSATNTTSITSVCNSPITYTWSVTYSNTACGTTGTPVWSYTNGTSSTSSNPSFNFVTPGTYTIKVTMNNGCGAIQSATQTVTVKAPPAVNIGAISNVCGGSSAVISPTATVTNCGSNTLTYSWSFPGGTPSTSTNANPGTISYTTSGNHTVTLQVTNECGTTTDTETFTVTPEVIANAGNDVTLCSGGSTTLSGLGSGGSGSGYTYQWLSSTNTVLSNNQSYTVTPTATTTYTLKVTNGSCNTTDTVTVFINTITPGTIGTDQILCSGTDPAAFTETVAATGAGTLTYQWESSTASATGTFTDISGATSATYDPPVLSQTTWFRRKITSTLNTVTCTSTSNTVSVTINTITQSAIGSDQTICTGGVPAAFTAAPASGSGTITYQWQSSTDNITFSNISGATSATYSPATLTQTTYYKRIAKSTLSSVVCSLESNVITITVVADPTITTQPLATQSVCQNAVPTTLQVVAEGGVGTFTYQWFSSNSPNGSSATQISGATQSSYSPATTATGTKYYYCVVSQTGLGCSVNSSIVQVQVLQAPTINTQPISSTVCAGGNPALLTVAYTNGTGAASYQWYSNTTNSTSGAIAITGATTASYQAPASTVGVIYYYVIISFDSGGCSSITSAIASVTVNALPQIVTQPIAEQNICVGGSVSPLTVTGSSTSGAASYQWYSNTTNSTTGGTVITGANAASYTPTTYTTAGSRYYYVIITYANSGCGTVTSDVATVNVVADPVITTQPVTTQSLCQSPLAGVISVTASGGYGTLLYQWYSNTTNSTTGGNSIAGATNATYTPPATTVGTIYYYCIITTAASGCSVTSNTSAVVVLSAPYVSTQPQPQTLCFGATPALLTTAYINGTGAPQYQWFSNNTNSNMGGIAISGATNSSYQPSGAVAGTTYYYLQITFATGGCSVITSNAVAVTINPLPQVASAQQQTICSGGTFNITPQDGNGNSLPMGTQYTWTAPTGSGFSGGAAQNIPQSSISQTLTNTTNAPVTATYTVAPIATSCSGQTFTVTITVNPKPFINTQAVTVCTGEPFNLTSFSGSNNIIPSGTTYSWNTPTMTDTNMGGQPATDATSITGTLTNITNTTQTATYSVTPKWTSGTDTCTGNPFIVTVTVKPKPAITTMSTSICSGGSFSSTPVNGTDGTVPTGTVYSWAAPAAQAGVSGLSAGINSTTISGTISNTSTSDIIVTYTVTPTVNGCTGNNFNLEVTVHPTPTLNAVANQTKCNGTLIDAVAFSSPVNGTTFTWTNNNTSIGLPATGTGDIAAFSATNNGSTTVIATITVTPHIGSCNGTPQSFTITVNPAPAVNFSQSNQSVCSGSSSIPVNLTSLTSGASISWTAVQPTGVTGVETSGTNNIPAQPLTNSTNSPIDVIYTAVASTTGVSCPGASYNYVITVKPKPNVATQLSATICSEEAFNVTPPDGNGNILPAGTQYTWTTPANSSITGEANQTTPQTSIGQTLTNTTNAPVTVTYTVTPIANGCSGSTFTVTVTVNPKPVIQPQSISVCTGEPFDLTSFSGSNNIIPSGTTYSWNTPTMTDTNMGGQPATDEASIAGTLINTTNTTQTATYSVTPKWTSGTETCTGNPFMVTVTVKPKPAITTMSTSICSGGSFSSIPVNNTDGTVPAGTVYSWAAPAAQSGVSGLNAGTNSSTISGTITNTNTTSVTVTYSITPSANGCAGTAFNLVVTVAPTPTVEAINNITACNQDNIAPLSFVETVNNTIFHWANDTTSIGLAGSGTGNILPFTASNTGINPVTATITVTPEINGCFGAPQSFTITVNPAPTVTFSQSNQTICSGTASTAVLLTSATSNTTINWTATAPSGITGVTTSGTTTIPAQTLVNSTNASITVIYQASATTSDVSACPGAITSYTITVTPVPFVNGTQQISTCSGTALSYIPANTGGNNMPAGVTFTWGTPTGSGFTGGSAQSTPQNSLNQTLVNTTNVPVMATYTITPHYSGCDGVPFTVQVTVNPTATIPDAVLSVCSGEAYNFNPATTATVFPAGTTFNWSAPAGNVSGGAPGSAQSLIAGTLTNTTTTTQTATYTITPVSPQGNCNGTVFTLTVNVNPVFTVSSIVSDYNGFQISSAGASDGFINLTPSGGTGTYTYSWTGPGGFTASTQNITGIGPGTYTVLINDGLCQGITLTFTIIEPLPLIIAEVIASHIDVDCFGQSTGVIEVEVTTVSIAPFDYALLLPDGTVVQNADNLTALTHTFSNLAAGTYNVRVTDANGTIKFINGIQVTQPASGLAITASTVSNFNGFSISCNGAQNGSIDLTVSGGYPGYTYNWTGPNGFTATTQDLTNLNPGVYTVTILDTTNACPVTQSFTITEPGIVAFTGTVPLYNGFEISCFGGNNGSINIAPAGGTGVYTYSWTGPNGFTAATQNLTNLSIGTYQLVMTDSNGCSTPAQSFTLTQPTALAITETHVNVLCFGFATGSIDVTVTGGVLNTSGVYTYSWTGPNGFSSNTEDLTNVTAGTYNLIATDANGCTIPISVTVTQQPEIIITPTTTPITCYGANNASISLAITGGDAPYVAQWSNLATGTYQDNLAAGNYVITVTDASNCIKQITVVIPEAPVFMVTPVVNQITCHEAHNGSIALNLVGGIAPVTLVWSDGSNQGTTRNNLGPGTYTASITDGTPCQIIRTFTIVEPAAMSISANLTHALDCNNALSGAIDLVVGGGTPPYIYNWSNGQTIEDLNNITSGTYSVTVTDASGCSVSGTYNITRPDPISLNVTSDVVHNCDTQYVSQTNVAQAAGGVPPFQYTWSSGTVSGSFGQYMNTDQNGTVIVTATDSSGCTATSTFEVDTQQLGEANFTAGSYAFTTYQEYSIFDPVHFDNLSTGDYTEVGWDFGDGASSQEISPDHTYLREGTYTVILHVIYPYGCSDTYTMTIVVTKGYAVMVPNAFTPNADGHNDTFNAVYRGLKSIELNVFDTWGALIYSEKGEVITGWNGYVKGNPSENGNFYYRIKAETFYGQVIDFEGPFVLIK